MTPPPSRWKLHALLSASLLLVAATGTFTFARFRNDAARRRVEAACRLIERSEQDRNAARQSSSKLAQGKDDAEKIASIEKATRVSRVCDPLQKQLSGYRWNFGRHWSPPPVDTTALPSRDEIAAIGARAKPLCMAQMGLAMETWRGDGSAPTLEQRQAVVERCDLEKQSAKALDEGAAPLRLLDEWPAELERRAAGVASAPQAGSLD